MLVKGSANHPPDQMVNAPEVSWLLQTVLESFDDGIIIIDLHNRILHVNSRLVELIGCPLEKMLGQPVRPFLELIEGWFSSEGQSDPTTLVDWSEKHLKRVDGRKFRARVDVAPLYDPQQQQVGNLLRVSDITERKWMEEYLRLLESVVVNANELVMITQVEPGTDSLNPDPLNLKLIYINNAFLNITGFHAAEVIGKSPQLLFGAATEQAELDGLRQQLTQGRSAKAEILLYGKDGRTFWADVNIVPIYDDYGQLTHYVSVMREATARKQAEEQLRRSAFHDPLTGLPNRLMFMQRLAKIVDEAKHDPQAHFSLLFLDLDRFKVINDSLGHLIGDQLLITIARRLESCLQKTDLVARLGGDEFTILLQGIDDLENAKRVADRIHRALAEPFDLGGNEVFTSVSIGIAMSHNMELTTAEDVLRGADIAMYRAKAHGKACHQVFDRAMHRDLVSLMHMETDLRRAIEYEEFELFYQPIVSLSTGRIAGFEALVRWPHPEQGYISPGDFITLAEETGLILPIGTWVLREACRQMRQWQHQFAHYTPLMISVNLSTRQFAQPNLPEQIQAILEETTLSPNSLKLEITESAIMDNSEAAMLMLEKIKQLGVQLAVDDFGTGYSSLGYLYRFPMDVLKIDQSFVSRIDVDGEKLELVRTITTLAWNLGMDVIAEGIETTKQLAQLKALKCEYGQGYLFARPMSGTDATAFLSTPGHPLAHLAKMLPID
jgi:diguanylate cyclase (GGDEF)-like protein/PAS domain S-box-containing protein